MSEVSYKSVIFDMGGVIVRYRDYESMVGFMKLLKTDTVARDRFHEFERGSLSIEEMKDVFELMMSYPEDLSELENMDIEDYLGPRDPLIDHAIQKLRFHGYKIGLLTNNGFWSTQKQRSTIIKDLSAFDVVVESCRVGARKPDAHIYNVAAERLGVRPHECIFVDDLAQNVEAANIVGMRGVLLPNHQSDIAVAELEKLLGLSLFPNSS